MLSRLLALRASSRLSGTQVRAASGSLGVTERTVWRWLAAGRYEPEQRIGWQATEQAIHAYYAAGGSASDAWRGLRAEGVSVPSLTTFRRALRAAVPPAERPFAREGEDGRRRFSVYGRWEPQARNEVWEADHAELDVRVLPLRGSRLVRPG